MSLSCAHLFKCFCTCFISDGRHQMIDISGDLVVSNVQLSDSFVAYTCKVKDSLTGTTYVSATPASITVLGWYTSKLCVILACREEFLSGCQYNEVCTTRCLLAHFEGALDFSARSEFTCPIITLS